MTRSAFPSIQIDVISQKVVLLFHTSVVWFLVEMLAAVEHLGVAMHCDVLAHHHKEHYNLLFHDKVRP